jgi:hypothetical protein
MSHETETCPRCKSVQRLPTFTCHDAWHYAGEDAERRESEKACRTAYEGSFIEQDDGDFVLFEKGWTAAFKWLARSRREAK